MVVRGVNPLTLKLHPPPPPQLLGSFFSNDNGEGNEYVTNLRPNTKAVHALHMHFSFWSISLPWSAKQQCEIVQFEVLWRTSTLGDKFSFFSPKLCTAHNVFIPEGLPYFCCIKKLEIVVKRLQY